MTSFNNGLDSNLSLIWIINAPIHSFINAKVLEPFVGCGSSLEFYERGEIKFIYSSCSNFIDDHSAEHDGKYLLVLRCTIITVY